MSTEVKNEVLSTLAIMGYGENYIERAMKIHNKSKFGTDYNLSLLVEIIDRLKQKDAKKGLKTVPFRASFASADELISYLRVHNTIDFRFDNGRYILCKILQKDLSYANKILLHPASQPLHVTKHNKYCFIYQEYHKLAVEKSVTLRKMNNKSHKLFHVRIDEYIDINPLFREGHAGWKHGQIIKMDPNSSQVKVLYFLNNENHSFWVHLENTNEAAPFNSKYDPLHDHIPQNFNEFHDVHPLKRFTSIDVIDNVSYNASNYMKQNQAPPQPPKPKSQVSEQQKQNDAIKQLMAFGYDKNQIISAMKLAKDKTDINEIIECIEREEQNNQNNQNNAIANSHHQIQISEMPMAADMDKINANKNEIEIDYNMIVDDEFKNENNAPNMAMGNVMKGLEVGMKKPQDFDNQLSSMAFGNDLMMDDIIDQMEMGDDGQNDEEEDIDDVHSTPMGPTPMGPKPPNGFAVNFQNEELLEGGEGGGGGGGAHYNNPLMEGIGSNNKNKNNYKPQPPSQPKAQQQPKQQMNFGKNKKGSNKKVKSPKNKAKNGKSIWKFGKKNKKNKRNNKLAVFGVNPMQLSSTLVLEKDYKSPIPNVLIKLRTGLFGNNGHLIEGIFRIAPNRDECKVIENQLNDGKLLNINFSIIDGDLIANLIKLWFRCMPQNICQHLIGKNKIEACDSIQKADGIICNDLIEPGKSYFLWLLDLCNDIIEHMSVNKMGVKAMAVVIAPNLYNPEKLDNPMVVMAFSAKIIKFMQFAIQWRQNYLDMISK